MEGSYRLGILVLLVLALWTGSQATGINKTSCYDCNYSPSGYLKNTAGDWKPWPFSRMFQRCALEQWKDDVYVHKWNCNSGVCFIRKDGNGMVYRGCADSQNLPWGVDSKTGCLPQPYGTSGQGESLWWFCKGHLCNDGQLDNEDRCGDLATQFAAYTPPAADDYPPHFAADYKAHSADYQNKADSEEGYNSADQYSNYVSYDLQSGADLDKDSGGTEYQPDSYNQFDPKSTDQSGYGSDNTEANAGESSKSKTGAPQKSHYPSKSHKSGGYANTYQGPPQISGAKSSAPVKSSLADRPIYYGFHSYVFPSWTIYSQPPPAAGGSSKKADAAGGYSGKSHAAPSKGSSNGKSHNPSKHYKSTDKSSQPSASKSVKSGYKSQPMKSWNPKSHYKSQPRKSVDTQMNSKSSSKSHYKSQPSRQKSWNPKSHYKSQPPASSKSKSSQYKSRPVKSPARYKSHNKSQPVKSSTSYKSAPQHKSNSKSQPTKSTSYKSHSKSQPVKSAPQYKSHYKSQPVKSSSYKSQPSKSAGYKSAPQYKSHYKSQSYKSPSKKSSQPKSLNPKSSSRKSHVDKSKSSGKSNYPPKANSANQNTPQDSSSPKGESNKYLSNSYHYVAPGSALNFNSVNDTRSLAERYNLQPRGSTSFSGSENAEDVNNQVPPGEHSNEEAAGENVYRPTDEEKQDNDIQEDSYEYTAYTGDGSYLGSYDSEYKDEDDDVYTYNGPDSEFYFPEDEEPDEVYGEIQEEERYSNSGVQDTVYGGEAFDPDFNREYTGGYDNEYSSARPSEREETRPEADTGPERQTYGRDYQLVFPEDESENKNDEYKPNTGVPEEPRSYYGREYQLVFPRDGGSEGQNPRSAGDVNVGGSERNTYGRDYQLVYPRNEGGNSDNEDSTPSERQSYGREYRFRRPTEADAGNTDNDAQSPSNVDTPVGHPYGEDALYPREANVDRPVGHSYDRNDLHPRGDTADTPVGHPYGQDALYPRVQNGGRREDRYGIDRRVEDRYGNDRRVEGRYGGDRRVEGRYGGDRRVEDRYGGDRRVEGRYGGDRRVEDRYGGDRRVEGRYGGDRREEDHYGGDRRGGDRYSGDGYGSQYEREHSPRDNRAQERYVTPAHRAGMSPYSGYRNTHPKPHDQNTADEDALAHNPCDGQCLWNPSHLFRHAVRADRFVQCTDGVSNHGHCKCCVPVVRQCPYGLTFDDVSKVCNENGDSYSEPLPYKPINH